MIEGKPISWTAPQAADWLGVHIDTLYAALNDGTVPGRKVGREWRIPLAELARWFDGPEATELPELLTAADVQAELQLGRSLTYRLLAEGEIPSQRIGRQYLVSRKQLTDYSEFF